MGLGIYIKNLKAFFFINLFIYSFIFGCVGSLSLCEGFLQLRRAGAALHRGARASHYRGLSCCGAQAQQLWLTGPAAPRHVGSSQTRARTRVPCISRRTPNHCATREAPPFTLKCSLHLEFVCACVCVDIWYKWPINIFMGNQLFLCYTQWSLISA